MQRPASGLPIQTANRRQGAHLGRGHVATLGRLLDILVRSLLLALDVPDGALKRPGLLAHVALPLAHQLLGVWGLRAQQQQQASVGQGLAARSRGWQPGVQLGPRLRLPTLMNLSRKAGLSLNIRLPVVAATAACRPEAQPPRLRPRLQLVFQPRSRCSPGNDPAVQEACSGPTATCSSEPSKRSMFKNLSHQPLPVSLPRPLACPPEWGPDPVRSLLKAAPRSCTAGSGGPGRVASAPEAPAPGGTARGRALLARCTMRCMRLQS